MAANDAVIRAPDQKLWWFEDQTRVELWKSVLPLSISFFSVLECLEWKESVVFRVLDLVWVGQGPNMGSVGPV